MLDKHPQILDIVKQIYLSYVAVDFTGTCCSQEYLGTVEPTPLPGAAGRSHHKHPLAPCGPIGLLLQHTHYFGASLDICTHSFHRFQHPPLYYLDMPFQIFKSVIPKFAFDAVHFVVSKSRTYIHDLPKFDPVVFKKALPSNDPQIVNALKSVASCSTVDQSLLHRFDNTQTNMCVFCNQCVSSTQHIIWHCTHPALVQARQQLSDPSQQFVLDLIPHMP
eukprot:5395552-Karenia_brevis.AAC.1